MIIKICICIVWFLQIYAKFNLISGALKEEESVFAYDPYGGKFEGNQHLDYEPFFASANNTYIVINNTGTDQVLLCNKSCIL